MRIAINTRFLLSKKMEGFGWFTYEVVKRIVEKHPEHEFIFFFDRAFDPGFIFAENVRGVVLSPPARHPILFRIWFNISVTRALKKHKADLFFSPDGYLSLKTSVPQVAVIHDLNFEHYPKDLPRSARDYLANYFPKFAQKATHIITVSEFSKQDIVQTYGVAPGKITVAHNGASDVFRPIPAAEKNIVRDQFTKGEEYFVFVGAIHPRKNVARLLEAFLAFKKETSSKTKLLIVGENLWRSKKMQHLPTHDDVVLIGHQPLQMLAKIVASAKAMVFISYFEGFGIPLVEAMKAGCPVLSGNLTSLPEVAGDAVLYCDPFDITSIRKGLERIDSDEELRAGLIEKGKMRGNFFSWDASAEKCWSVIYKILQK